MPQLYAHLAPKEAVIWTRFLARYGDGWERYDYDVRVGEGRPVDPSWPPEIQDMARRLSLKRIDAIGYRGAVPTLFEVSPRGGRALYGALHLYERLFREATGYVGALGLAAVTLTIDPDVLRVMQAEGIAVYLIPVEPGD